MKPLTVQEELFCAKYVGDGVDDPSEAWLATFKDRTTRGKNPRTEGRKVLRRATVQAEIARLIACASQGAEISAEAVITEWARIAFADPRELITHRRVNCRYCWGKENKYFYSWGEWDEVIARAMDTAAALKLQYVAPPKLGGVGFDDHRPPHPDCPECGGRGHSCVFISDMDNLSINAAALFAGVKQTQYGIEIQMHSKTEALKELTKIMGLTPDVVKVMFPQFAPNNSKAMPSFENVSAHDAADFYLTFVQGL